MISTSPVNPRALQIFSAIRPDIGLICSPKDQFSGIDANPAVMTSHPRTTIPSSTSKKTADHFSAAQALLNLSDSMVYGDQ
jgi:hypothetical protein